MACRLYYENLCPPGSDCQTCNKRPLTSSRKDMEYVAALKLITTGVIASIMVLSGVIAWMFLYGGL